MKWFVDERSNHTLVHRKTQLARVWKRPDGKFQIAIDLPLNRGPGHQFDTLSAAKAAVNETVTDWFERMA